MHRPPGPAHLMQKDNHFEAMAAPDLMGHLPARQTGKRTEFELCFPIPKGFIAELATLQAQAGSSDPAYDALLCFQGLPDRRITFGATVRF